MGENEEKPVVLSGQRTQDVYEAPTVTVLGSVEDMTNAVGNMGQSDVMDQTGDAG